MRIRPPTALLTPKLSLIGSARRNGASTHHQTTPAVNPLAKISLIGNAVQHPAAGGNRLAAGTTPLPKFAVSNGAALARRRSKGQGVSPIPLKGTVIAATALYIDSEVAVVQLYNSSGNPSGYGPSDDPEGVFFGDTSLVSGDVWWPSASPAGCTITPLPGGSFTIAVAGGTAPGAKTFTWTLRRGIGGVRSTGTKGFTVT